MAEHDLTYALAASSTASTIASGHLHGAVRVSVASEGDGSLVILKTLFDQDPNRLAVSHDGQYVTAGAYNVGLQLWDWRAARMIWENASIRRVQSLRFGSDNAEIIVDTENGTSIVAAENGRLIKTMPTIRDASASGFSSHLCATTQDRVVLVDRVSESTVFSWSKHSFGMLASCFTPESVVIAETDGHLHAYDLRTGGEIGSWHGPRWSAFMRLAPIKQDQAVGAWASVYDDSGTGELVRVDLRGGGTECIARRSWQHAAPMLHGAVWTFEDGSAVQLY